MQSLSALWSAVFKHSVMELLGYYTNFLNIMCWAYAKLRVLYLFAL